MRALGLALLLALAVGAPAHAGCSRVSPPKPRASGHLKAPSEKLDARRTYRVTLDTNCGSFTITLDPRHSPNASASFVALARRHFFDGTVFHRIVPGFVIQGGDPTATGGGGPGYSTRDGVPAKARYVLGVVAMAKTQTEPPGTAGSQFFVVTGANVGLPPDYALLGTVTKGLDVVRTIGTLGDPATELPTRVVEIRTARVAVARAR